MPAGRAILDAYEFLQRIEAKARPSMQQAPRKVINRLWQCYAITAMNTVDRMAYTYCVFDRLKDALRRRELCVTPAVRYADPLSPQISDVCGARFWRIDPTADYGAVGGLARHKINLGLIAEQWDEILRLVGSLAMGVFHVESLVRTLQRGDRPTKLARALGELGRIIKTIYLLEFVSDEE